MPYKAVIGLGYGDEGKGLFTDYLCSKSNRPLVIRFSGGQQAGHTVVRNGVSHVFSNFGAGTLSGAPSYFSSFCTIDPIGIVNELSVLLEKGVNPLLFVDEKCPVTTPYDAQHNQNNNLHGSCGVGVGATISREENYYSLTFGDLFYPWGLTTKLSLIKDFYANLDDIDVANFLECCEIITNTNHIKKANSIPVNGYTDYIFEGSQGLLLDKNYGFFPYVTRGNTGTQNILQLLEIENLEVYLVTRAYQTRHGKGPLSNEMLPNNISKNPDETNKYNLYQGEFRYALLDVSLLEYIIQKDKYIRNTRNKSLVITCLDHIRNEYRFTYNSIINYCKNEAEYVDRIANLLKINTIYLSSTPESKNIKIKSERSHI